MIIDLKIKQFPWNLPVSLESISLLDLSLIFLSDLTLTFNSKFPTSLSSKMRFFSNTVQSERFSWTLETLSITYIENDISTIIKKYTWIIAVQEINYSTSKCQTSKTVVDIFFWNGNYLWCPGLINFCLNKYRLKTSTPQTPKTCSACTLARAQTGARKRRTKLLKKLSTLWKTDQFV